MPLKREPTKALQLVFVALLVVSIATAAWWVTDYVLYTRDVQQRLTMQYETEAAAANALLARGVAPEALAPLFAYVEIGGTPARATVRQSSLDELDAERKRRTNRYVWEGGFFLLVLIAGLTVLTRTIRHDAELRRRQQNFLAAVSHEFKSPLASVRLAAETLVMRSKESDTQRLGGRILEDCDRLLRMVDNLLETTRLEEGRHRLAPTQVNVRGAADNAVAELAERAKAHGIAIGVDIPADPALAVRPTALESALRNLLDNAVKACVAGGGRRIEVTAARTAGGVELAVRDDGLGLPPDEAGMIFEKFYRSGDELRRTMPGTGLGLYIVKRLVELSGGRISASSEGPGRGATVRILWPDRRTA